MLKKDNEPSSSQDMLATLLPLLNNPQVKSKLTPSNISMIMGLLNNWGNPGVEKPNKALTSQNDAPPATSSISNTYQEGQADQEEKKEVGRYLNWKTNFDAKEV